ncbi:MAG: HAD family phosphatase [Clostridia bacterium]
MQEIYKSKLGVIFDMDGVLVDSEDAMKTTSIESLKRYGINPGKEDFVEFTGMGEDAFIGGVARKHGLEYKKEMKDYAYMLYVENARELVFVYPDVPRMLREVRRSGIKMAVASAADMIKVRTNLACIGLEDGFFHAIVTGSDVINKKPHPEIFLKAAEKLCVAPKDCIVLEDAVSGIKAAGAAGMESIGITTAFPREELIAAGAGFVVDNIQQAYDIITEWKKSRMKT